MPHPPHLTHKAERIEKEAHKYLWKITAFRLAASCHSMQQATQLFMEQKWADAKKEFIGVVWNTPEYEVISWRIVVFLGALQKIKALRPKDVAAKEDKGNIFAKPFISPMIKKQLNATPFKPLIPAKIEVETKIKVEVNIKVETNVKVERKPRIKAESTHENQATLKKEVTIKSEVEDDMSSTLRLHRSTPLTDNVKKETRSDSTSPLKRKLSGVELEDEQDTRAGTEVRAVKRTRK